jgi:hypothetical protein
MESTSLKDYRCMRIKMKISYHASREQISILELFLNAISLTYSFFHIDPAEQMVTLNT